MLPLRIRVELKAMNSRANLFVRLGDAGQVANGLGDICERALDAVTAGETGPVHLFAAA
jgi:hypothetical protein